MLNEDHSSRTASKKVGRWVGCDRVAASTSPPGGLDAEQVPMFVSLGWDDNGLADGMAWALGLARRYHNPDRSTLTMTFYVASRFAAVTGALWKRAFDERHEIGNHTESHSEALQRRDDISVWRSEMEACRSTLVALGIPESAVVGFRTPFIAHSGATLEAVAEAGFHYDCSLEEGYEDASGRSYRWPYTLDDGSPGNALLVELGDKLPIAPRPGLWELPAYAVIVPPDERCEAYGIASGLRAKLRRARDYFDPSTGHVTGFDYNLWFEFGMTPAEVAATLKHTLDQRLLGNRAPFLLGMHSDIYDGSDGIPRRAAIEEFVEYAASKREVRIVSAKTVLDWMRAPTAL